MKRVLPSKILGFRSILRTLQPNYRRHLSTTTTNQTKTTWDAMPKEVQQSATLLEHARAHNYQIQPLSKSIPDLDQRHGYQIAAAVRQLRESTNGEVVVGRKIGFSNRNIWPEYNINASNWSYMYQSTVTDLTKQHEDPDEKEVVQVDISHLSQLEPRIEPEIVLGVAGAISSSMNDKEILESIEWIAHGFEVVASIFPNWKFTAAETTAAFALHGLLLVGKKVAVKDLSAEPSQLLENLEDFKILLHQNNQLADEGKGSNALGSPVRALRHLGELLEEDEFNATLSPSEIVTTGTLTRALPISHGDVWSTELSGIDLPGLRVKFKVN